MRVLIVILLNALTPFASAQVTQSTWTKMLPPSQPSGRSGSAMAFDAARNQIVLFGGSTGGNETWTWDGSNWVQRFPAASPPSRMNHALVYDAARSQTVLFGGFSNTFLSDTWVWDGSNWTHKFPSASPPARYAHAMAYDPAGHVVLFGGAAPDGSFYSDTWTWDGSNWVQRFPSTSPAARGFQSMAFDALRSQTLMAGGIMLGSSTSETWTWDGNNWAFGGVAPPAFGNMAFDNSLGLAVYWDSISDGTWTWNGSVWTRVFPTQNPASVVGVPPAMAYDGPHAKVVLFGLNRSSGQGETWVWGTGSVPSSCNPPATIFVDSSGGDGLIDASPSNQRLVVGTLNQEMRLADINVTNQLRVWLGILNVDTTTLNGAPLPPTFDPNLTAGIPGLAAQAGFLQPCQTNLNPFSACHTPGLSAWTASFCGQGDIDVTFAFTASSALVTITDLLIPASPAATTLSLSAQLQRVPDVLQAALCLVSQDTSVLSRAQCAMGALRQLIANPTERTQVQQIFENLGISLTLPELIKGVAKLDPAMIQVSADLVRLLIQSGFTSRASIKVIGM